MALKQNDTFRFYATLALVFAALVFALANARCKGATPTEATVQIMVIDDKNGVAYGSGTCIAPHVVATAAHVTDRKLSSNITITLPTGKSYHAECVALGKAYDTAILWVAEAELPFVTVAQTDPRKGDIVTCLGYGRTNKLRTGVGQITKPWTQEGGGEAWQCAVKIESGDSGGGVFNAANEFCGIMYACEDVRGLRDPPWNEGAGIFSPASSVVRLCQAWGSQCGPQGCFPFQIDRPSTQPTNPMRPIPQAKPDQAQPPQFIPLPATPPAPAFPDPTPRIDRLEGKIDGILPGWKADIGTLREGIDKRFGDLQTDLSKRLDSVPEPVKAIAEDAFVKLGPIAMTGIQAALAGLGPAGVVIEYLLRGAYLARAARKAAGQTFHLPAIFVPSVTGQALPATTPAPVMPAAGSGVAVGTPTVQAGTQSAGQAVQVAGFSPIQITPQPATVTQTNYVPIEQNLYDRATAIALEKVAQAYPGAAPYLSTFQAVRDQALSGLKAAVIHQ